MYFLRVRTNVHKVSCSFPACRGELVKYQTCLMFLRPLPTRVTDPNYIHLATGMPVNLMSLSVTLPGLSVNETGLSVSSIRLVSNMEFQAVCDDKQTVREVSYLFIWFFYIAFNTVQVISRWVVGRGKVLQYSW